MEQKEERDHDFFHYDNSHQEKSTTARHLKRKVKPYTSSRTKTSNFLLNIAYNGVKEEDFLDNSFVFDTFALLTKKLNPFSLESKIADVKNIEINYMLCEECAAKTFYYHICEREDFLYLNGNNVLYPRSLEIVMKYIEQDSGNIVRLRRCLHQYKKFVQFIYSRCYPEIYSLIDKRGIEKKGELQLTFKSWKDKKKFQQFPQQQEQQQQQEQKKQCSDEEAVENDENVEKKLAEKREIQRILAAKNEGFESSKQKRKSLSMKKLFGNV